MIIQDNIKPFADFVIAREEIRLNRERHPNSKEPKYWTLDPILQKYKFCNINREDDYVTKWVHEHIRLPLYRANERTVILNLLLARIFNHPPTLKVMGLIDPTRESMAFARDKLFRYQREGHKLMRGAYMMGAHGSKGKGVKVIDYFMDAALNVLHMPIDCSLSGVAETLRSFHGIGAFIANQVAADLRYTYQYERAHDWGTFVLPGPGTRRGLNRLYGRKLHKTVPEAQAVSEILALRSETHRYFNTFLPIINEHFTDPNNVSNSLCEYDKYARAKEQLASGERVTLKQYYYGVQSN